MGFGDFLFDDGSSMISIYDDIDTELDLGNELPSLCSFPLDSFSSSFPQSGQTMNEQMNNQMNSQSNAQSSAQSSAQSNAQSNAQMMNADDLYSNYFSSTVDPQMSHMSSTPQLNSPSTSQSQLPSQALHSSLENSFMNSVKIGVDKLKDAASSTLPQKNLSYMSRRIKKESISPLAYDEFESDIETRSLKRRRKVSQDELREKNRIYAKNHRAEKKRRQEELLKRNEMLEKENRHLRRLLMQLGIQSNGNVAFNPAQTIKNVGSSLVKGVKGGIGFMIPTNGTKTPIDPSQTTFIPHISKDNIPTVMPSTMPQNNPVQGFSSVQNPAQNTVSKAQSPMQYTMQNLNTFIVAPTSQSEDN